MGKCSVCFYWEPEDWDGSKGAFKDYSAYCGEKGRFITRNESCESFTIIDPSKKKASKPRKKIISFKGVEPMPPLFEHQKEAIAEYDYSTMIPLFMEAGCAKSATILRICKNKYDRGEIDSILVIAPNKIHTQWYNEQIPLWLQDCKTDVQIFGGDGGAKHLNLVFKPGKLNILCVNTDTFSTPSKWEMVVDWTMDKKYFIVLDEATKIKNIKAKRSIRILYAFNEVKRKGKAILSSRPLSVGRAILTGTPVTNSVMDLWSMMEFLKHNYWGRNYYAFKNRYGMYCKILTESGMEVDVLLNQEKWEAIRRCDDYGTAFHVFGITEDTWRTIQMQDHYQGPYKHVEELKEQLQKDAFFRRLVDCVDMPEQTFIKRSIVMGAEQTRAYQDLEKYFTYSSDGGDCSVAQKIALYTRLMQCSSGFLPLIPPPEDTDDETYDLKPAEIKWFDDIPKMDLFISDVMESDRPSLVITRYTAEASRIFDILSKEMDVALLTGWKTVGTLDEFKAGKYDCLVANIACVSMGLNLQNCHTTFFYSNTFSLEHRIQSERRTFRIGQKQKCTYFDYVSEGTIDMKIVAALHQRRDLMDYIRGVKTDVFLNEWDDELN